MGRDKIVSTRRAQNETHHSPDHQKGTSTIIDSRIVLIDGELLSQLMIDYNVGVAPVASYELKRIDSDYFLGE